MGTITTFFQHFGHSSAVLFPRKGRAQWAPLEDGANSICIAALASGFETGDIALVAPPLRPLLVPPLTQPLCCAGR
jgi:hypothetical protein